MYQGCNSRGVFSKLSNFPLSTMRKWTSTDLEMLVHFHIVERGKLESLESLKNIPNFSNVFRGLKRPFQEFRLFCEREQLQKHATLDKNPYCVCEDIRVCGEPTDVPCGNPT